MTPFKKIADECLDGYFSNRKHNEVTLSFATKLQGVKLDVVLESFKGHMEDRGVDIGNIQVDHRVHPLHKVSTQRVNVATFGKAIQNVRGQSSTFLTFSVNPRNEGIVRSFVTEAVNNQPVIGLSTTGFEAEAAPEPKHPLDQYAVPALMLAP